MTIEMEAKVKSAILITARLKSTRLKEKVLKPVVDRPMLSHLVERLRTAEIPEEIILCTSTVEQDDRLESFAREEGLLCYRGHPDDVLLRMLTAAETYDVDTIVSCTADNPFVDPVYIDKMLDFHWSRKSDFTRISGLPFGTFSYALERSAVKKACDIKDQVDTEVWGGYFTQTGLFNCNVLDVDDGAVRWPELRLTVDTQDDFDLVSAIFAELYKPGSVFTLEQIVALCRQRNDLASMNQHIQQASAIPIRLKADV